MSNETKQPPNWMGFERFTEEDNKLIRYSEKYANPDSIVSDEGQKMGDLYLLVAKMAQTLDEIEQKAN